MNFIREVKNQVLKQCKRKVVRKIIFPIVKLIGQKTYIERILKIEAEGKYFFHNKNNKIVLRGPFKGMEYATFSSYGSELSPKIIGSYEMELNEIIENVIKDPAITEIIDIGSAEGYYAIGFAMRKPKAKIYAFDIKQEAIDLCKSMAVQNKVTENITYGKFCSNKTLKNFRFTDRAFIMSDCEGYESSLFDETNLNNLIKCDILIEMHDFINPKISSYLKNIFHKTHDISIIKSKKRNPEEFPELSVFTDQEQKLILSECRIGILDEQPMEWLFAKSKL